uniref:EGF-like domain-containing protein n=1 Tax=Plectus sambesii TaxID=2011161 RepID=A0A914UPT9_9BILA
MAMSKDTSISISGAALLSERGLGINVKCDCPEIGISLDNNCRHLPNCQNGGFRAFSNNLRCSCPEPYFGELCESICDHGERLKSVSGRDYCSCLEFFQGEECRDIVCLNGGTSVKGRCVCLPEFLGYHCENGGNRTVNRYDRYDHAAGELFTRDISGSIFSLIMIIVLVVSMYLLVKRRMQMQQRMMRREENYRSRLNDPHQFGITVEDHSAYIAPFRLNTGPPPYMPQATDGASMTSPLSMIVDDLPPLPSYEDATKQPPLSLRTGGPSEPLSIGNEQSPRIHDEISQSDAVVDSDAPSTSTTMAGVPPIDGQSTAIRLGRTPARRSL